MSLSKSALYYRENKSARDKKKKYDSAFGAKPTQVKKRVEANAANRKAGTYGNGDKIDMSHTKNGTLVKEPQSKNRARQGANGKSTKK